MSDLDKLKNLLFGAEKEALDSIAERVERPEMRASDVADVLAEAVHRSHKQGKELVDSMAEPVGECLQQAFHKDPQTYSDALYPVMGPAIRKSIAHTLRTLSQQINQAVEQSLTPKGIGWRIQAYRAGIPFGDFVLQKTLLFRVEQAYLISRENGLLIEHVHHENSKIKDSDAVSAMFTAIQDFVKESFSPDRTGRLESADMGEFTLWAVHGPHALLVCVIRGTPPASLRADLSAVLERIHFRYADAVRSYVGDTGSVPDIQADLEKCLEFQALQQSSKEKRRLSSVLVLLLIGLAAWLGYYFYNNWVDQQRLAALRTALQEAPGVYVADTALSNGRFQLRGMRDPLAKPIAQIVSELNIPLDRIDAEFEAFQSLDSEMLAYRIDRLLDSDAVQFELTDSALVLRGEASGQWLSDTKLRLSTLPGLQSVDFDGVVNTDFQSIEREIASLNGARFQFTEGAALELQAEAELQQFARRLRELQATVATYGKRVELELVGSTDSVGTTEFNRELARERADRVARVLATHGVAWETYRDASAGSVSDDPAVSIAERYVAINLTLRDLQ
ncbi:MAG: hypothetical protein AAFX44_02245 [Pseudomonadota bacterium]